MGIADRTMAANSMVFALTMLLLFCENSSEIEALALIAAAVSWSVAL